jgi:signal transduction histidine kinase
LSKSIFLAAIISLLLLTVSHTVFAQQKQGLVIVSNIGFNDNDPSLPHTQLKVSDNIQKEFINIAAHELRNPIQPILSLTEIIRRKEKDSQQKELLDIISRNAQKLKQLTEDVLNVTKIESKITTFGIMVLLLLLLLLAWLRLLLLLLSWSFLIVN